MNTAIGTNYSRGDLVRALGKTWEDFRYSLKSGVEEMMQKVTGATQVCAIKGHVGDEYQFIYHIQPEGVTLHINLGVDIKRTLTGSEEGKRTAKDRIMEAFKG